MDQIERVIYTGVIAGTILTAKRDLKTFERKTHVVDHDVTN